MADPQFPNRPDHPDFWMISQALIDTDAQAEGKQETFADLVGRYVDPESLTYAATQRALRMTGPAGDPAMRRAFATLWMDAFVAGCRFSGLKARDAQAVKDDDPERP